MHYREQVMELIMFQRRILVVVIIQSCQLLQLLLQQQQQQQLRDQAMNVSNHDENDGWSGENTV